MNHARAANTTGKAAKSWIIYFEAKPKLIYKRQTLSWLMTKLTNSKIQNTTNKERVPVFNVKCAQTNC